MTSHEPPDLEDLTEADSCGEVLLQLEPRPTVAQGTAHAVIPCPCHDGVFLCLSTPHASMAYLIPADAVEDLIRHLGEALQDLRDMREETEH